MKTGADLPSDLFDNLPEAPAARDPRDTGLTKVWRVMSLCACGSGRWAVFGYFASERYNKPGIWKCLACRPPYGRMPKLDDQ